jgi:uncharacterized coiled-coil protein SlyX
MQEFIPWVALIISAASLAHTIIVSRGKAHAQRIGAIETSVAAVHNDATTMKAAIDLRVDRLEDRVTRAESEIAHLPDKDVTHRLEMTVSELRGDVRALTEGIKPIRAIADRVQEALLDRVAHTS